MVIEQIVDYLFKEPNFSTEALETAHLAFIDAIGCAVLALKEKEAVKLLGPLVPGTHVPGGIKVPLVKELLDPVTATFNLGLLIRWLDFNDTWLAKEWGHPSDNIGALISLGQGLTIGELLKFIIQVYEIQGVLSLSLSCNRLGLDHVYFVKIASCAIAAKLLGLTKDQVGDAISQAFIDGGSLRVYRQGENTGARKSWAAGDASSRGVYLAYLTKKGEIGYPQALFAKNWGVQEVIFKDQPLHLERLLDEYVINNILFKVLYPAEFHAQTAIEAAIILHPQVKNKLDSIEKIRILTHDSALRIIDKKGPLKNPADRDHCLQYMVAVALIKGKLKVSDYEEESSKNPLIDQLRNKMEVTENQEFSKDYHLEGKRSIASSVQLFFKNGEASDEVVIEFPIGHFKRREEAKPLLMDKFNKNIKEIFNQKKSDNIVDVITDKKTLISYLMDQLI